MKKRRLLACALSLTLTLTSAVTSVFAASFSDVDNDATVSWAKDSIQQMADAGYIKGYEDGTFKPYRSISKMECLLLMSRMLGVEEADYADVAAESLRVYGTTVKKYNTTYVDELCYLLYNGIITESDLASYASTANANTELLRYQAAILMSKLLGTNSEAAAFTVTTATYPDDSQIPATAKSYVEYVTKQGIMNGMASTDGSATVFSPNTSLTRAQMATLLSRMIAKINKTTYTGTITALDLKNNSITVDRNGSTSKRTVNEDTVAYYEGARTDVDELEEGDEISAVEIHGHVQMVSVLSEGVEQSKNEVVYAKISALIEGSTKKITLADSEDSTNTATYTVADNCSYVVSGTKATFADLKKNAFVKVTVNNGKIIAVEEADKSFTVTGKLADIDYDDDNHVYITVADDNDVEQTYVVSNSGATVVRNSSNCEYRDLSTGDTVKLTVAYGKVTRVTATSTNHSFTGVLTEIHNTAEPYLTLSVDGKTVSYKLRSDAEITISNAEATIYDLRRNTTVTGILDGEEIKSIAASSVTVNEKGQVIGTLVGINTSYKVLNIQDENGNLQSVYYNSKTNFLKSSGTTSSAKELEKGVTLNVTGAENNGIFEATIIIVQ